MFFFSSRRRHTRCLSDWSSDVCSSDLALLLSCTGILGAKTPWNAKESDFWNRKEPAQRSSEEIDRLVTASPWAKPVKASRSEERRVGKECRYRWSADDLKIEK